MDIEGRLWVTKDGENLAGRGRIELLLHIDSTGSITQAAKAMKMSYKAAWDAIAAMNMTAGVLLVERLTGGKGGGGSRLTSAGYELIAAYERYEQQHQLFLQQLANDESVQPYLGIMTRWRLATSARNQLFGTIKTIASGEINNDITIALSDEQILRVTITHQSVERLQLRVGCEVYALIKASWIHLTEAGQTSQNKPAENNFSGTIQTLITSHGQCEVRVNISDELELVAVVPWLQNKTPQWLEGQTVTASIYAADILLGVM